jgi:hypothetical protein
MENGRAVESKRRRGCITDAKGSPWMLICNWATSETAVLFFSVRSINFTEVILKSKSLGK